MKDINKEAQNFEIYQAIQEIRNYIEILVIEKKQSTDIADELSIKKTIKDLSMAIFDLESQYNKVRTI